MCVMALEDRVFDRGPSHLPLLERKKDDNNLMYEGHFVIDAFLD